MGIPGLMHNLAPYGHRKRWSANTETQYPRVIIDGPAFAYFIYGRVAARQGSENRLPLDLIPTYEDIAAEAVQYLQALEKIGFKIRKIYFDGFVPPTKLYRHSRLVDAIGVQDRFRKAFPAAIGQLEESQSSGQQPLSKPSSVPLPKPPFLVPAVLEALFNSELDWVTETVPLEADTVCASTSTARDLILTNDTDLIVLQPQGKIAFFTDCFLTTSDDYQQQTESSFECTIFDTRKLCQSLNCPDLVQAVFRLSEHPHQTLTQCAQWVREDGLASGDMPRFNYFKEQYSHDLQFSDFPSRLNSQILENSLYPLLKALDPRDSEVVHSSLSSSGEDRYRQIEIRLQPLTDDTLKHSAWITSREVRKLGYALLKRCGSDERRGFTEVYRARGPGNPLAYVGVSDNMTFPSLQQELEGLMQDLKVNHSDIAEETHFLWRFIILRYAIKSLHQKDNVLPSLDVIERLIGKGNARGELHWDHAHISATAEGVLYSLRMLRQIGQIYLVLVDTEIISEPKQLVAAVRQVIDVLGCMPPLPQILVRSSWFLPLGQYETLFLETVEREFGLVREFAASSSSSSMSKVKQARNKEGGGKPPLKGLKANASRNIYSALPDE